jgi:GNAT superfamily N-acetyltransferase
MQAVGSETVFRQFTSPVLVDQRLFGDVVDCWVAVSDAGGAVGFPFPPVDRDLVAAAAGRLIAGLDPERSHLIVAEQDGELAGWVNLTRDPDPLIAHWGTVHHLQTHPQFRGRGIGAGLMRRLQEITRDDLHLSQLHLAARGGLGLEDFYARLGWREIGRWPAALRLGDGEHRDEVLMLLAPV